MWVSLISSSLWCSICFVFGTFLGKNVLEEEAYDFYIFMSRLPWETFKGCILGLIIYGILFTFFPLWGFLSITACWGFFIGVTNILKD